MLIKRIASLSEIPASEWNNITGTHYPFIRHEFLAALEQSGCANAQNGWIANHLLAYDKQQLIACMPLYLKTHSRGEYVFDHQWAQAYHRNRLSYYPKLLTAIPFTPCQNQRLFFASDYQAEQIFTLFVDDIKTQLQQRQISSWHGLFISSDQLNILKKQNILHRTDLQYHWYNHKFQTFNDFLSTLNSKYRKKINRERRRIEEQEIRFINVSGHNISDKQRQMFQIFYESTYLKKGMPPYLNEGFFLRLIETMPEQMQFVFALQDDSIIAGALFFIGSDTLYGRYWGCLEEYHSLHFETCFYQGIELCIRLKLAEFDSGAQGEHKLARGFRPVITHSAHLMQNQQFHQAIARFLEQESEMIQAYKLEVNNALPFKQT